MSIYNNTYNYCYELLYCEFIDNNVLENIYNISYEESITLLNNYLNIGISFAYKYIIPKRSYKKSYIRNIKQDNINISNKLNKLKEIIQPEQRTDEWYIFRNSTLTASNIWKIFSTEYTQTQLILEKCEPLDINKFSYKYKQSITLGSKI